MPLSSCRATHDGHVDTWSVGNKAAVLGSRARRTVQSEPKTSSLGASERHLQARSTMHEKSRCREVAAEPSSLGATPFQPVSMSAPRGDEDVGENEGRAPLFGARGPGCRGPWSRHTGQMTHGLTRRRCLQTAGACILLTTGLGARARAMPRFRVRALPDLGGGNTRVHALNDLGVCTGMSNRSRKDNKGVTFIAHGDRIKGLPWTGVSMVGRGINNDGWVVEHRNYKYYGPEYAAWVWVGDHRVPVISKSGLIGRFAAGINNAGVATGTTLAGLFRFHAGTGEMEHLPEPHAGLNYEAQGIADTGMVVGHALYGVNTDDELSFQTLIWRPDATQAELLTLPDTHSHAAQGVNVHGTLCGWYARGENLPKRAFTWRDGVLNDLGDRLGVTGSRPFSINNDGWIAGEVYPQVSRYRRQFAALWVEDEAFMLNDLLHPDSAGWDLRTAVAINARGQIVGDGVVGNHQRPYIATPV
jgi:uncharacterized membrane protein